MKRQYAQPKYSVAEMFCGCGGFSHGFWRTGRFQTVLGNDVKKYALQTFKLNHSHDGQEPAIIEKDIRTVPDSEIIKLLQAQGIGNVDCLLGGPPCQGFSQMRRTAARCDSKIFRFGGYNPGGHIKFPHLWPGQNPPPERRQDDVHPSSGRSF